MSTEVLQITMAWERKRKQAEADLRDQLNEAEDTITEMGDKVATLERELAAAKHDAEIASDMVKSVTAEKAEIARDLKDEQVRVLGALFLIADLAQEPPKPAIQERDRGGQGGAAAHAPPGCCGRVTWPAAPRHSHGRGRPHRPRPCRRAV